MGDVFIWRLFNQVAISPFVWGEPTDEAMRRARRSTEDIPAVLDYLEVAGCRRRLPVRRRSRSPTSRSRSSSATPRSRASASTRRAGRGRPAFVERVLALPSFARLAPFEDKLIRTPIAQHRAALAELGAPLSAETYGSATPRRGVMRP